MYFSTILVAAVMAAQTSGIPQPPDNSQPLDTLQTSAIVSDRGVVVSRTDTVDVGNSMSITEVLQQSPSLLANDYGGEAGIKTVSLRGLGSTHTAIYVDGVRVGNIQSGQTDLGTLGIENFSSAVVDYAQNSLSFLTARPTFAQGSTTAGRVSLTAGSFSTYRPAARIDFKLSDRTALSINGAAVFSKGDFRDDEGNRRQNNDIAQFKAGADLFGGSSYSDWHVKAYLHSSERGAPGTVSWPSEDRQKDANAFVQGLYRRDFAAYNLNLSAKISYDDIHYTSTWGDSRYGQTEAQLNSAHKFRIREWWDVSLAADVLWDALKCSDYEKTRTGAVTALATAFRFNRLQADAAVEYDGIRDNGGNSWSSFSPSADIRFAASRNLDITAFARRAHRMPCFNELYYTGYGNPDLKPEDATLLDLGAEWHSTVTRGLTLKARLDAFHNYLVNKITSSPSAEDPNIWRPYNIGAVRSYGFDSSLGLSYADAGWHASLDARYSYQSATDVTEGSWSCGVQIPYVARHNACLYADAGLRGWTLDAIWNLRAGRRDSGGDMPDWATLDVNLTKAVRLKNSGPLTLRLMCRNITNCRYELSSGYPMPGASITGGAGYQF